MKTQKITRKGLQEIYNNVCETWQKEITKLVLFNSGDEIEVEQSLITKAFSEADVKQNKLLTKYFKIEESEDEYRMKICTSWESLLKHLGKKETQILPYKLPKTKLEISINNHVKICTIIEFLNDDWICDFTNNNQYKYYPYFYFKECSWRFYVVGYHCSFSDGFSALAYLKNKTLAEFMGKNFIKEYSEYLQIKSS